MGANQDDTCSDTCSDTCDAILVSRSNPGEVERNERREGGASRVMSRGLVSDLHHTSISSFCSLPPANAKCYIPVKRAPRKGLGSEWPDYLDCKVKHAPSDIS